MAARQLVEDEVSRADDQRLEFQHKSEGLEKTVQVRRTFGWKMIVGILVLSGMLIVLVFGRFFKHRLSFLKRGISLLKPDTGNKK